MRLFDWHQNKAETNLHRHGVTFQEASTIFDDDNVVTFEDDREYDEVRFISIGRAASGRFLFVVHTDYEEYNSDTGVIDDVIRIISARVALPRERRQWYD